MPKRTDTTKNWKKLINVELHMFYPLPTIVG